jgi:hypothetical protein
MNNSYPRSLRIGSFQKSLFLLIALCIFAVGMCNAAEGTSPSGYSILVEQSPVDAGHVTPETGVYRQGQGDIMSIKAMPKPGYRFLYWLGDVEASTENETTVNVNSPKIIVAVFAREQKHRGGSTMLRPSSPIHFGSGGVGTVRDPEYREEHEDVPEPATLALLGTGALLTFRRRKK